jgi:KUP system potassium uptake protein
MLSLGALGVVFGDIGTSPLYALKECINPAHGFARTPADLLGILSLIFWSLTMVVTFKYVTLVLRADNRGEGGIFAMLALLPARYSAPRSARIGWISCLVMIGAALLYGEGVITPAISVLSAVEGLEVAAPQLEPLVVPVTIAILIGLFAIQKHGTGTVAKFFGPVMAVWFLTIACLGLFHITRYPDVLRALSPVHAATFFAHHGLHGMSILGSVVLAFTGGEALYADMGHFGARPIRIAWLGVAMPALVLCYFGQGALLLHDPAAAEHPFFALVPRGGFTIALVVLSAMATVIASQALISGAFSLTRQAVQLGYLPRVTIKHTSGRAEGQIYVPEVNWALAIGGLGLVLGFGASSRLAAAYGIAVTGTMAITSIVFFRVMRQTWRWPLVKALPILVLFLSLDLPFFAANLIKFPDGGYVPVLIAIWLFITMMTWRTGHALVAQHEAACPPLEQFWPHVDQYVVARTPGAGIFLVEDADSVPSILMHHLKRVRALPEVVILLKVITEHVPVVEEPRRWHSQALSRGFYRLRTRYGFMEKPDIEALLHEVATSHEIPVVPSDATYYIPHASFLGTNQGKMGRVSERVFAFLERNARDTDAYLNIPPAQVVEFGTRIDL